MLALPTTAKAVILVVALSMGPAAAATPPQATCRAFRFPVYFPASSAALTPAADRVIHSAGERMRSCRVEKIEISIRNKPREARLDQTRAEVVSAALFQAGAPTQASIVIKRQSPFHMFRRRVVVSVDLAAQ
jgi:hypothetical protein